MAEFKPFATISGQRYWFFKPKDMPERVFAYNVEKKTAHHIGSSVISVLRLEPEKIRVSAVMETPKLTMGESWGKAWYERFLREKGPVPAKLEPKLPPSPEKVTPIIPIPPKLSKGHYLYREKDRPEVYAVDPRTGIARWLDMTAKEFKEEGWSWGAVQEISPGSLARFTIGEKWKAPKPVIPVEPAPPSKEVFIAELKKFKLPEPEPTFIKPMLDVGKTAVTTPAMPLKIPELTPAEKIVRDVRDIVKKTEAEKEALDREYQFSPEYWKARYDQSLNRQATIASDELTKVGFKFDSKTEEFKLSATMQEAVNEIKVSGAKLDKDQKDYIILVDKSNKLVRTFDGLKEKIDKLEKESNRQETIIRFEEAKDRPDKSKMDVANRELIRVEKEREILLTDYQKQLPLLETIQKDLDLLEKEIYTTQALFKKETMPTKWANLFALQDTQATMMDKIDVWRNEEKKAVLGLYETGVIHSKEAAEMLRISPEEFKKLITSKVARRRQSALSWQKTELKIEADKRTTAIGVAKEWTLGWGSKVWNFAWKALDITFGEISAVMATLWEVAEMRKLSKESDAMFESLISPKPVKEMSAEERRAYGQRIIDAQVLTAEAEKLPDTVGDWAKLLKQAVWEPDPKFFMLADLVEEMVGPPPKGYEGEFKFTINALGFILMWQRGRTYVEAAAGKAFTTFNRSIKIPGVKSETVTKWLAESFHHVGSDLYKVTLPKILPTPDAYLRGLFVRTFDKNLPSTVKKFLQYEKEKIQSTANKQYQRILDKVEEIAPDKKKMEELKRIYLSKELPRAEKEFRTLALLDPDYYGALFQLGRVERSGEALKVTLKGISKSKALEIEKMTFEIAYEINKRVPELWQAEHVVQLLQREAVAGGVAKYHKAIADVYGKKTADFLLDVAKETRKFYDLMHKIPLPPGTKIKIPWSVIKGIKRHTHVHLVDEKVWKTLGQPRMAAASWNAKGSASLAKTLKNPILAKPILHQIVILRKSTIRSTDEFIAELIHETAHLWISELSKVDDMAAVQARTVFDTLAKLLNQQKKANSTVAGIYQTLKKIYPYKTEAQFVHEFYALALEIQSMVRLNKTLWLKSEKIFFRNIKAGKIGLYNELRSKMLALAQRNQLLNDSQLKLLIPSKLSGAFEKRLLQRFSVKFVNAYKQALEGGIDFADRKFPAIVPYLKGYVAVKGTKELKRLNLQENKLLKGLTKGWELPRLKKTEPYKLMPGMFREISRRTNYLKAREISKLIDETGWSDPKAKELLEKYLDRWIKTGKFPRQNPIALQMLKKGSDFASALAKGQVGRMQRESFEILMKRLKKMKELDAWTPIETKAIENLISQLGADITVINKGVADIRRAFGLYPTIKGEEVLKLFDIEVTSTKRIIMPLVFKRFMSGAWKEGHPVYAEAMRKIFNVINLPIAFWKWMVLFGRPGWGVRNDLDDVFRVGLNAKNADFETWKWMAKAHTPGGWKEIKTAIRSKTPSGKMLEMSGFFAAENPFQYSDVWRSWKMSIASKSGLFRKLEKYAFQPAAKLKRGWELPFTAHETIRREALFIDYVFKAADKTAKAHLERIWKMQKSQKLIVDELKALIPDEKIYEKLIIYAQRIVEGTISKAEKNYLLRLAKKYKLKDTRILEDGFKEVDRILFDYSDLMKIERGLRWVFPFYGFWSKNFVLWAKAIKNQPRLRRAAIVYIKAIEEASKDLPEWYKERIKIWGAWYTLPLFSIFQVLDVWKDPVGEIIKWKENKNHPISGLAWNPAISTFIKKKTGKGYWDDRKDFKDYGWTEEMINRLGKENVDLEANTSIFEIYARQIPVFNLAYTLSEKTNELLRETDSAIGSKNLNAWTSYLLGFSLKKIDDLQILWGAYWRMLPQDRNKFMATLSKEEYDRLYLLLNLKNNEKLIKAEELGIDDPVYIQYMEDFPYRFKYYELLDRVGADEAKYYLATNKEAREALQRQWDLLEYSPKRAAQNHLYQIGQVRNMFFQILKQLKPELKPGEEAKPALWQYIVGQGYQLDYTKEDFENDVIDEDGNLIPETLEELMALIPFKGKKWLENIVKEQMEKMAQFPEQWYREVIEADKRTFNYLYSVYMQTFGKKFIPWDIPASIDERGAATSAAYTDLWDKMPDDIKAEYLVRNPYKAVWHDYKSQYLKKIAVLIDPKNLENWYENFYTDKYFSARDREYYFIKHALKRKYYPTARLWQAEIKKDEANRAKGIFTNHASEFLDKIPKDVQTAWEKDSPNTWESHRWWKGYHTLINAKRYEDAVDYFWSPNNQAPRERYFINYPEEKVFRVKQKTYWKMPRQTWEEEHEAFGWLFDNPDYIEWTHRFEVTDEQKAHGKIRDELHEVKYKIKPEGKGLDFLMEMAGWEAKKRQIYEENPWLEEEYKKGLTPEMRKKYEVTREFFEMDPYDYDAKQEFLKLHPELKKAWRDMAQPWERRILDLQDQYFKFRTSAEKEAFLKQHPELQHYWTSKSYPWSFWYDKTKFKQDLALVESATKAISENIELSDRLKEILARPKTEDERFIANKIYQWSMQQWITLGQEDSQKGWEFFDSLPLPVREIYFKKHPGQREYFAFTNEWYRKIQISPEEGNKFFNSSLNREWRERYFERHPEARAFFKQLNELSKLPRETWEDQQKIRSWWARHEDLKEWLARRETEDEKEIRMVRETYFAILDRIPLVGSGKAYWEKYFRVRSEADEFLKDNEELRIWLAAHRRGDEQILKIQEIYFALDSPEKRFNYLQANPQLKDFWFKRSAPKKREVLKLQEQYFAIAKHEYEKRNKFLIDNLELLAYWNAQNLPYEYYFEPKKFKIIQGNLSLFKGYFDALIEDTAQGERIFTGLPQDFRTKYLTGTLDNYEKNQIYLMAMSAWHGVIEQNFLRGNYYFKSLPLWIRKRYFLAHPEKQFVFSIPLEDFIMEPLKEWEKENPQLAWAYRIMYEYGQLKHLPSALREKVEEIFIKAKIWEDRKLWTVTDWKRYWEKLSMLKHEIREKDIERLPRLKQAIERAGKQYPMKPRPKPIFRRPPRRGVMRPWV